MIDEDALGAIALVGTVTQGLKIGGKALGAASKIGKAVDATSDVTGKVLPRYGSSVSGGTTVLPNLVSPTSKTGKVLTGIEKGAGVVANPANMFQLGTIASPVASGIASSFKNANNSVKTSNTTSTVK